MDRVGRPALRGSLLGAVLKVWNPVMRRILESPIHWRCYAGPRGRSRYVADAVAQRVRRDALGTAISETAGIMRGRPGAMSPEAVAAWVDELRTEETE